MDPRTPFLPLLLLAGLLPAQDWIAGPATGPTACQLPRMVHDPARNQVVLFGGYRISQRAAHAETWLFDGKAWTRARPATVPPARDTFAMSYDSLRRVVVLFGGVDSGNFPASINDQTWEWNGKDWSRRQPATAPSPRFGAAMAFDSTRQVHLLFGGTTPGGSVNDTWEWNGTTWRQVTPATRPPARSNHAMVFDPRRRVTLLFGGSAGSSQLGDHWEFDGKDWRQVTTPFQPGGRTGHGMAYDLQRGVALLFGGRAGTTTLADTWEYDGTHWYQYQKNTLPGTGGRTNLAMAFMVQSRQAVIYGGAGSGGDLGDTWLLAPDRPSLARFGAACGGAGGTPLLTGSARPALGARVDLGVAPVPAKTWLFLLMGLGGTASIPLPAAGCRLHLQPNFILFGATATGTAATFPLTIPQDPVLLGVTAPFQATVHDPPANSLGWTFTNGLRLRLY